MDDLQECRRANQALRSRVKQLEKGYDLERTAHNRTHARAEQAEAALAECRERLRDVAMSRHLMDTYMHPVLFEECTEMLCRQTRDRLLEKSDA